MSNMRLFMSLRTEIEHYCSVDCQEDSRRIGCERDQASGSYQAVTVAEGHFAGVRLVLEVSHILTVRGEGPTPS